MLIVMKDATSNTHGIIGRLCIASPPPLVAKSATDIPNVVDSKYQKQLCPWNILMVHIHRPSLLIRLRLLLLEAVALNIVVP